MLLYQQTISRSIPVEGRGLHHGKSCKVTLHPAAPNTGIQLGLIDQEYYKINPILLAHSHLCSGIAIGKQLIYTVEHLLAAIFGLDIDNIYIQVDSEELPILDGSAKEWVDMLKGSIEQQNQPKEYWTVSRTIHLEHQKSALTVTPFNDLVIDASIDFSHPLIGKQQHRYHHTKQNFSKLSHARTFGFLKDHQYLKKAGYAQGASPKNCIILTDSGLYTNQQLRDPKEFIFHKIIDFLGDLAVLNLPFVGNFTLQRPSHSLTQCFVKLLVEDKELLTKSKNRIYYS